MNSATTSLCLIWLLDSSLPVWRSVSAVLAVFLSLLHHPTHHDIYAHAELPGFLPPGPNHLQLHAHCDVAHPAFSGWSVLGNEDLRNTAKWRESAAFLQLMLNSERLVSVSRVVANTFQWKVHNTCLKSCIFHYIILIK